MGNVEFPRFMERQGAGAATLQASQDGYSLATDSSFCHGCTNMAGYMIRQLKNDKIKLYLCTLSVQKFITTIKLHSLALALSIRQSAEWGMKSVQALQHKLDALAHVCRQVLDLCVQYYNYCTRTVCLNQICTVYHPEHSSLISNCKLSYYDY